MTINNCNDLEATYQRLGPRIDPTQLIDFGHQLEDGLNKHICTKYIFNELGEGISGLIGDYDAYIDDPVKHSPPRITPDSRAYLDMQMRDTQSPFFRLNVIEISTLSKAQEDKNAMESYIMSLVIGVLSSMILVIPMVLAFFTFRPSVKLPPSLPCLALLLGSLLCYSGLQKLEA